MSQEEKKRRRRFIEPMTEIITPEQRAEAERDLELQKRRLREIISGRADSGRREEHNPQQNTTEATSGGWQMMHQMLQGIGRVPQTRPTAAQMPQYPPQQGGTQVTNSYLMGTEAAQQTAMMPTSIVTAEPASVVSSDGPVPLDLVKIMKKRYAMCVMDGQLYVWGEGYYHLMSQNEMESLIWLTCEKEVEACGSRRILTGTYQLLLVDPSLQVSRLTTPDNLINFRNGLYRLDDGAFLQHTPAVFTTYTLQCDYQPMGVCPVFDKFLYDTTGGDPELIARIWEIIGCCLSPEDIKVIVVLQGVQNSGKSVACNAIDALFPASAKKAFSVHALGGQFTEKDFKDKAFCVSADLAGEPLSQTAVGSLKRLSGRDVISSDVKYKDPITFRFRGRILLVTNHPLLLKKEDPAFMERIVTVPFRYTIPVERRDFNLEKKIMGELSAIASKALTAYLRLRRNGFRFSGNYPLNSPQLFGETVIAADPATQIYLFLQQNFEAGAEEDLVVVEEACEAFNTIHNMSMTPIQFSGLFCQQAAQMYGAEKVRSRAGGHKNARSCLKRIRLRQV